MSKWNIEALRINQLKVLSSLMSTRNVSETAETMHLSQSAISKILAGLRSTFDDELFVKTANGMEPTSLVDALMIEIEDVLAGVHRIKELSSRFDPATSEQTLVISSNDFAQNVLLRNCLSEIKKTAPRIKIRFLPFDPANAELQLMAGDAHLVVADFDKQNENIQSQFVFNGSMVLVHRNEHLLVKKKKLTTQDIASGDLVQIATEVWSNSRVLKELATSKTHKECSLVLSSFVPLAPLLTRTDYIAVVPRGYFELHRHYFPLAAQELPFKMPPLPFVLNWHRRNQSDPMIQWFVKIVTDTLS